jgi:hypothetical protein
MSKRGEADPWDRPQRSMKEHYKTFIERFNMEADSSNRPKLSSPHVLLVFNIDLLGSGFTSADELGKVNIGPTGADVQIQCLG